MNEKIPTWLKYFSAIYMVTVMAYLPIATYPILVEHSTSMFMARGYSRYESLISQFVSPCVVIISFCITYGMFYKSIKEVWKNL
jgi:hypothetical protein